VSDVTTAPTVPPEMLETLSRALAQTIAVSTGGDTVVDPAELTAISDLHGGFTLKIEDAKKNVWTASINVPTASGQPYIFKVVETVPAKPPAVDPTNTTWLDFEFVSGSIWSFSITAPPIPAGSVTIQELDLTLGMGTIPPPPK
jgi:hypothetical protein